MCDCLEDSDKPELPKKAKEAPKYETYNRGAALIKGKMTSYLTPRPVRNEN